MKLNFKSVSALMALALVLAFAAVGLAQQGGGKGQRGGGFGRGGGHHRGGILPFARDLNLTDEQKAQIEKIHEGFEQSTASLREQARGKRGGEFDALGGTFDESAVRAAAQARANAQVELEVARARMMSQVYSVLTAEQKAKINERRQQFEQKRQERGKGRRGGEGQMQ